MNEAMACAAAAARVAARQPARRLRCEALHALLGGAEVPPALIDSPERLRKRTELLNLEGLSPEIAQDPRAGRVLYEAVIGKDDTLPSRFLSDGGRAALAVGRIVVQQKTGGVMYGTGSLISQHLLLTNHHVLQNEAQAAQAVVELGYAEAAPGQDAPDRRAFALDPSKLFYTSPELDYTLVGVVNQSNGASTARYGNLPLITESGKALVGERVNIIHHAGGRPQAISIRANAVVDIFDEWIHYEADTEPGSSGAAVFNDEWQLVAIHHASVPAEGNGGVINEGIRISALVQDLAAGLGN